MALYDVPFYNPATHNYHHIEVLASSGHAARRAAKTTDEGRYWVLRGYILRAVTRIA